MRRWMRGVASLLVVGLLALGLFLHGSELARGERPVSIHPPGVLGVVFNMGVAPKALPAERPSPVSFSFSMKVRVDDESAPPALREVVLRLDRGVVFSTDGLPICRRSSLVGLDMRAIERVCGDAIVGSGGSEFVYTGPPIGPVAGTAGGLLVLNGGVQGGATKLYAVDTSSPTNSAVVTMPIEVKRVARQGVRLTLEVPESAGSRGALTDLSIYFAEAAGVLRARCQDGDLGVRVEDRFADGTYFAGAMSRKCVVKPARRTSLAKQPVR